MKRLIKADIYKLQKSRTFWIGFLSVVCLMTAMDFLGVTIVLVGRAEFPSVGEMSGGAYRIYYSLGTAANYLLYLLPFYLVLFSHDFEYGVVKTAVGNGVVRRQYLLAKYMSTFLATFFVYSVTMIIDMGVNTCLYGFGLQEEPFLYWKRLIITLMIQSGLLGGMGCFFLTMRIWVKRSSTWIGFYLFFYIGLGSAFIVCDLHQLPMLKILPQHWILMSVNNHLFSMRDYFFVGSLIGMLYLLAIMIGLRIFEKRDLL